MQNLVIAAAVITALVPVELPGHLPLPRGLAGREGSTVLVGLNGLRLLSRRAWRPAGQARCGTGSQETWPASSA